MSFSNIYAKETAAYEKFDSRNLQEKGKSLFPPSIGIGQTVGNKNIPPGTAAGMDRDKKQFWRQYDNQKYVSRYSRK